MVSLFVTKNNSTVYAILARTATTLSRVGQEIAQLEVHASICRMSVSKICILPSVNLPLSDLQISSSN